MPTSANQNMDDALSVDQIKLGHCYISGRWQPVTHSDGKQQLFNPATGEVIATASLGNANDVDTALSAATAVKTEWRNSAPEARGALLDRIADGFVTRRERLIGLSTLNNGKIRAEAAGDLDDAVAAYRYYAEAARNLKTSELIGQADEQHQLHRRFEPVGVSALIVPWNFPMVTTAWKVAPALAAGCPVVLKPSEITLLPELVLGNIADEAGVPAGVLNIVPGGADVGQAMVADARVRKVSFTGSNAVGEQVMCNAATHMQKTSLELGGKSPIVVFDDVDIDWAIDQIIGGIYFNAGQMCSATSRLIVADTIADDIYARLKKAAERLHVGPGNDETSEMGPLVSSAQLERVRQYTAIAQQEELNCLTGGHPLQQNGFFFEPTIYTDVRNSSRLWQEEIFGPVLVTARFSNEEQAIRLANDTDFGLAATVLSRDITRGWRVMNQIDAGAQWLNDYQLVPPNGGWGGFKQSGNGRELGTEGLRAYQETKYIVAPVGAE